MKDEDISEGFQQSSKVYLIECPVGVYFIMCRPADTAIMA